MPYPKKARSGDKVMCYNNSFITKSLTLPLSKSDKEEWSRLNMTAFFEICRFLLKLKVALEAKTVKYSKFEYLIENFNKYIICYFEKTFTITEIKNLALSERLDIRSILKEE